MVSRAHVNIGDILLGQAVLIVGVEDNPDGGLRVYLGHRGDGIFVIVKDEASIATVRRAWSGGQHCFASKKDIPDDALWTEETYQEEFRECLT